MTNKKEVEKKEKELNTKAPKKKTNSLKSKSLEKNKSNEFVIIESGGKQYLLEPGAVISIEKIDHPKDSKIEINSVLLHSKNGKTSIGSPYLDISVQAEIIQDEKDKKIRVFKFKKKTGFKKTQGHRQTYTTIRILSIGKPSKPTSSKSNSNSKQKKLEKQQ